MVKHLLEHDYDISEKPSGFIPHFWDTIDALGGYLGIFLLSVGILLFFFIVDYTITSGRKKREGKKKQ